MKKIILGILISGIVCFLNLTVAAQPKKKTSPAKVITNSLGMKFVLIPKGTFQMGAKTVHPVTISRDFYMGQTEVTQAQWKALMDSLNDCSPKHPLADELTDDFIADDKPISCVNWNDIQEFIKKLNTKGEGTYRLPTEAEWEYAARGGTKTRFYWGNSENAVCQYANVGDITHKKFRDYSDFIKFVNCHDGYPLTAPVGKFIPNKYGLYDMLGNVSEWVEDWDGKYPRKSVTDPKGPKTGSLRIVRGGGYFSITSSDYAPTNRGLIYTSDRATNIGFRLIRLK